MRCLKLHIEEASQLRLIHSKKGQKVLKNTISYYPFGLQQQGYNDALSGNVNYTANRFGYGGKELQEGLGLEMYDFGARLQDPSLGRWFVVDALAGYPTQIDKSPYVYSWNNPIFYTDPDGNCPICPSVVNFFLNAIPGAVQDNNSTDAHIVGVGMGINNGMQGLVSAVSNPAQTAEALVNLASPIPGAGLKEKTQIAQGLANDANALVNGNGLQRGEVIGRAAFDASVGVVTTQAGGVASNVVNKTVRTVLKKIDNKSKPSGLGDLTKGEVSQIQHAVDDAGRPIEVPGSAANGTRRNSGTDLPVGKGSGTKSDIDYLAPPSSHPYFDPSLLPDLDPGTGIIPGVGNPNIGPYIRFEPGTGPVLINPNGL